MRLFPVCLLLWSSLLFFGASQNETDAIVQDVCQHKKMTALLDYYTGHEEEEEEEEEEEYVKEDDFRCLLYPTNTLNCSWSFPTLPEDTQLVVNISTCDDERNIHSLSSVERVGSRSLILQEHKILYVILHFNITLDNRWTVYTYTYDLDNLEVLSPPQNISASFEDGDLLVTWSLPLSQVTSRPRCFEYQLDMGDQERLRNLTEELSTKLSNADPSHIYNVRIRTRKDNFCQRDSQWSDWSHTVTVKPPVDPPNLFVNIPLIIAISLGIPMILLAVLLVVRSQRVSMVLFPPIPRPPPKYIHFLEKSDTFNVFHPAPKAEPVEEITEVEDTEQDPGNAF